MAAHRRFAVLGAAGWFGAEWWFDRSPKPVATQAVPDSAGRGGDQVTALDAAAQAGLKGATPMAQRVAVVGLLNKRNSVSRDLTLKPGQAVRVGDTIVRLRACETTAPWEQQTLTGAFVQLDVKQTDQQWRRVFSGWLYKERPNLNVVQNAKGAANEFKFTEPETPGFVLKCDVHPWMRSYVWVFPNKYFAVSKEDGTFELPALPPGKYTLSAWQEKCGTQERAVTVEAGKPVKVELTFELKKKG